MKDGGQNLGSQMNLKKWKVGSINLANNGGS